jgi:hypothetical protein
MTHDQADTATAKKVVRLPKPDIENITVLTRELPNDPILPWNRYDSPWLEEDEPLIPLDAVDGVEQPVEPPMAGDEAVSEDLPAIAPVLDSLEEALADADPSALPAPDPDLHLAAIAPEDAAEAGFEGAPEDIPEDAPLPESSELEGRSLED